MKHTLSAALKSSQLGLFSGKSQSESQGSQWLITVEGMFSAPCITIPYPQILSFPYYPANKEEEVEDGQEEEVVVLCLDSSKRVTACGSTPPSAFISCFLVILRQPFYNNHLITTSSSWSPSPCKRRVQINAHGFLPSADRSVFWLREEARAPHADTWTTCSPSSLHRKRSDLTCVSSHLVAERSEGAAEVRPTDPSICVARPCQQRRDGFIRHLRLSTSSEWAPPADWPPVPNRPVD